MYVVIKGIIFDLDGTLIDSIGAYKEVILPELRNIGVRLSEKEIHALNGMQAKDACLYVLKNHFTFRLFSFLFRLNELKMKVQERISVFDETTSALERVKKYKLAVATSSPRKYLFHNLRLFSLKKYFKVFVSKDDVRRAKPSPDIFLLAAKKLGLKPSECVVVEDATNGVLAARRAGMKSIAVLTTTPKKYFVGERKPDVFVKNLSELSSLLVEGM